jgi:methionyl-tRNA synthetase
MAAFGPEFDALNFSEALKTLWTLVAETDGYLTANAPWKRPTDRPEAEHVALQARVLATAAEAIRIITALVYPILPESAAKVWRQIGLGEIADAAKKSFLTNLAWGGLKAGTKFEEPSPLFPRAEKDAIERMQNIEEQNNKTVIEAAGGKAIAPAAETPAQTETPAPVASAPVKAEAAKTQAAAPAPVAAPAPAVIASAAQAVAAPAQSASAAAQVLNSTAPAAPAKATPPQAAEPQLAAPQVPQHITIDDFVKVELRVAQILVAERIPKADKLLRLEVDLGYEKRQILAGIAQYYEPEKLIGRKIVIVANLAPRKMRGLESNGMLLAASLPDGAPVLAGFLEDCPLGARLK